MKPIIGVTSSFKDERTMHVSYDNIDSITAAGGIPFVLPNLVEEAQITQIAEHLDGLLLTGGGDIDPTLFGEEPHKNLGVINPERDIFEVSLIKKMMTARKPVLGICRGCQILNIAAGGDMYQDIYTQISNELFQHSQRAPRWYASHYVNVEEGSLLANVVGQTRFKINSFHHQTVREMAPGFVVIGRANDGVIEAFESKQHPFVMGVQWHPECMTLKGDEPSIKLFNAFVAACKG